MTSQRTEIMFRCLPAQLSFLRSTATHTAYIGGFGSGKSTAGILKTLQLKMANPLKNVAYYLPTYGLIRDIAFPKFEEFLTAWEYPYTLNKTSNEIQIPGYGKIIMRSMDNPSTIIGFEVCYSCIDEVDILPLDKMREAFAKIIARNRATTDDGLNITDMVGTPEGFGFAYQYFVKDQKPSRRLIRVRTEDNRHLPTGYIETLKDTYTPAQLQAYLNGEFVNLTSGRVYTHFDRRSSHTAHDIKPGEVLHIGMDFNIQNMAAVVHVIREGYQLALAELTGVYDTGQMIRLIQERYHDHSVVIYPDASGKNRSTSGLSDIRMLMQAGFTVRAGKQNPFVRDRINAMNLAFENTRGERRYLVNTHNCPRYTEALEQISYKNNEPDKESGLDHITDAGGYFIYMVSRVQFTI